MPKRTNRTHQSSAEFVKIISRVSNDIGIIANCFVWSESGVTCRICSADTALKGYFTDSKPCTDFNFSKLKNHVLTQKHYVRIEDPEVQKLHPLHKGKSGRRPS